MCYEVESGASENEMAPGNQHFDPQGHKRSNGMNFFYLLDVNRIESPPEQWLAYIFSEKKKTRLTWYNMQGLHDYRRA